MQAAWRHISHVTLSTSGQIKVRCTQIKVESLQDSFIACSHPQRCYFRRSRCSWRARPRESGRRNKTQGSLSVAQSVL